jgi:hypothetical protein
VSDFLASWAGDWGWLWMVIGLLGNVVVVFYLDD